MQPRCAVQPRASQRDAERVVIMRGKRAVERRLQEGYIQEGGPLAIEYILYNGVTTRLSLHDFFWQWTTCGFNFFLF